MAHYPELLASPSPFNWLADKLRRFGITSRTIRVGRTRAKGYDLADFTEAFSRFLKSPSPP